MNGKSDRPISLSVSMIPYHFAFGYSNSILNWYDIVLFGDYGDGGPLCPNLGLVKNSYNLK